jgi:thiamine transport system substrate-binding protein
MFMYPAMPSIKVPAEFTQYAQLAAHPATLLPELISANRDAWIQAWSEVMLP